jgi:hydroxymethylbilane synthase
VNLRIGTRGSALALWQANYVADRLRQTRPGLTTELVIYKTMGDHILDRPLAEIGGKGLFTKELEEGLHDKEIDFAVHSLKDMPTGLPEGLVLGAIPARADVRDCVIRRLGHDQDPIIVGTASLRRMCLAKRRWPGAHVQSIRGNVQTRMSRVHADGERRVDAVILAMAGILRLELPKQATDVEFLPLNPEKWIPAVGQGALAIECREGDEQTLDILSEIHHEQTSRCTQAERAFLRAVEGDCRVPVGAYATADGEKLRLRAFIGSPDGQQQLIRTELGMEPETLGYLVAEDLLNAGGREILAALREDG